MVERSGGGRAISEVTRQPRRSTVGGKTYYFIGDDTRREFEAKQQECPRDSPNDSRLLERREPARSRHSHGRSGKEDDAAAGHDAGGRQHDRHGRLPAPRQSRVRRRHRRLRLDRGDRRRRRVRPDLRQARRAGPTGRRAVRLRPGLSRALRRVSDQLHLLVRQLDRKHRDRGGRGRLPGGVHPGGRHAARERVRHRRRDLDSHVREHPRDRASSARSRRGR